MLTMSAGFVLGWIRNQYKGNLSTLPAMAFRAWIFFQSGATVYSSEEKAFISTIFSSFKLTAHTAVKRPMFALYGVGKPTSILQFERVKQKMNIPNNQAPDLPKIERLLKGNEVAKVLNISRSFAYLLMQTGDLPVVRLGRSVRVRPCDLENYISSNTFPGNINPN